MTDLKGHEDPKTGRRSRMIDDRCQVEAIGRGDREALAEVYRAHGRFIRHLAYRIGGSGLADDVAQEVFLRLWHKPERYDHSRGSLRQFLVMDTRARVVDSFRRDGSRRARETVDFHRHPTRLDVDVEVEALSRLVSDEVARVLATLPERERRAIVLAYFGGHSYRQVAKMLGQPEGTVKSQIRSGLATLRVGLHGLQWMTEGRDV